MLSSAVQFVDFLYLEIVSKSLKEAVAVWFVEFSSSHVQ